jgi:hypothetical protein
MSGEKIRQRLLRSPFVPFWLVLADGSRHAIRDAQAVEIVPRAIHVKTPGLAMMTLCPREIRSIAEMDAGATRSS